MIIDPIPTNADPNSYVRNSAAEAARQAHEIVQAQKLLHYRRRLENAAALILAQQPMIRDITTDAGLQATAEFAVQRAKALLAAVDREELPRSMP